MRITADLITRLEDTFNADVVGMSGNIVGLKRKHCPFKRHCYMTTHVSQWENEEPEFHSSHYELTIEMCAERLVIHAGEI